MLMQVLMLTPYVAMASSIALAVTIGAAYLVRPVRQAVRVRI